MLRISLASQGAGAGGRCQQSLLLLLCVVQSCLWKVCPRPFILLMPSDATTWDTWAASNIFCTGLVLLHPEKGGSCSQENARDSRVDAHRPSPIHRFSGQRGRKPSWMRIPGLFHRDQCNSSA
jgi:hypothetical protein